MPRPKRPLSTWRSLFQLLWMQPFIAIPFAFLFGTMNGASRTAYVGAYIGALYFSYSIGLGIWILVHLVLPRFERPDEESTGRAMIWRLAAYLATSLISSFVAALALHFTVAPNFLAGGVANVLLIAMFTLLFTALFMGIGLATHYYRKAIDRAGADRELQLARRIQRSFLLSEFPRRPRVEVHAVNVSSKEVSGDFYDVVPVGDESIVFVIADVSGKGVPAALLSSMLQGLVRIQAGTTASPAAATRLLNALACQREATGQFATVFLAALNEPTMTLTYTNAGHNPPVLLRAGGERQLLDTGGLLVGISATATYEEATLDLRPGDRLILYTDGVTEAARADGEMFGEERLYEALAALPATLDAPGIVNQLLARVREFLGDTEPGDDITILALRVLPTQ